ncbi:MAG: amidophosphoribosyltransferase, partial [Cyclobacteriaceae bacterium]|nr:amidophosphoribosyltransferase [Cyclobacteriaceae bacterium]
MSDIIKHECGIAMIRLRKPLSYYLEKYGTPAYAANKLYLLMEKQHNRGQDGAGVVNIKVDVNPGIRYISRYRAIDQQPISTIFKKINKKYKKVKKSYPDKFTDAKWLKQNVPFTGTVWLGHLRYGTHGGNTIESTHPMLRQNNWRSRNLAIAGNFNMTNVDELFAILLKLGQHPKDKVDTVTVLEKIGHFLDLENQDLFDKYKGHYSNEEITEIIENELDLGNVLRRACKDFDGGYAIAGVAGHGASFVARDPAGIRPAYYYVDDEIVVVASEKPPIKTAFDVNFSEIKEIQPGHALIIDKKGNITEEKFLEPLEKKSCSFERIYFSRGTDPDIYRERKELGRLLLPQILSSINFDLKNAVFSFIPNTAETSFLGMIEGLENYLSKRRKDVLIDGKPTLENIEDILDFRPRIEKIVTKDAKLRTFITDDDHRDELVGHVYDTTYEVVKKNRDSIVIIDDSIVRGTTLERSILFLLDKIHPKKIVIVSSAPQIRFPDCYGIDMSKMKDFVAFRAVIALIKDHGMESLLDNVYNKCIASIGQKEVPNYVK